MSTAISTDSMTKEDFKQVQLRDVAARGGLSLALNSFSELEKFSGFMAVSNFVPKHLRGKQADCLAVLLQSMRWEMDPFSVAQKTYFVNDGMAYEAQLINAVVLSCAQLKSLPKLEWSGEGEGLKCKCSGVFIGEDESREFEAEMKTITTRNSPLWKQQPKQQLGYFALRAWARLYCPDVLMGVYTKDEMEDSSMHYGADNAIDITTNREVVEDMISGIQAEKEEAKNHEVITPSDLKKEKISHKAKEAGADPEPGEIMGAASTVTDTAADRGALSSNTTAPTSEPNVDDWLHDINIAPDLDGLKHKYMEAAKVFAGNKNLAVISAAKDKRKLELTSMMKESSTQG